ncbi:MAG: sulfatase-like hydrolase/transferase, partial [Chitinophagales bacterium]|nr:sulfatase-like hydrolase/transferase [Chitinophagales bacterium]
MHHQLFHTKVLLKRLGILLIVYGVCRILFFLFNSDLFPEIGVWEFIGIMVQGLRYDIASVLMVNALFIIMHIIPNPYREKPAYQRVLKILFYTFNGIAIMFESGDFIYFRYGLQRTSMHELGLTSDTSVLPGVIKDFWYVYVIALVIIAGIEYLYRKTDIYTGGVKKHFVRVIHYPAQVMIMLVILAFSFIGARGGVGSEPLSPQEAAEVVQDERLSELVTNTSFSVLYAASHRHLREPDYFSEKVATNIYPVIHENIDFYKHSKYFQPDSQPQNVCMIVLESFSKEYIGYFTKQEGYTPFLDSLLQQGLCFTNGYSNGKSSNQGIIAINSSIPVLMGEPFISSIYGANDIKGIGTLLNEHGYFSYFFHGANNGSMGFDKFTEKCGFDMYFGRNEYNQPNDFDGAWGIFDEPFLKFTAKKMDELPVPFYSEIFTLSSHHPFTVPPQYVGKFKQGPIPMLEVVHYADYALQQFFEEAKKQSWYENTLFILTADHPGPPIPGDEFYQNQIGAHATWLLLYKPGGNFQGTNDMVVQQTDIMPTVLDFLGYSGKYLAFGNSIFDTTAQRL